MCFLTAKELIAKVPARLFRPRSFVLGRDHGWVEIVWWAVRNEEEWPGISKGSYDQCGASNYKADERIADHQGANWEAWENEPTVSAHDAVVELMSGGECLALEFYLQQSRGWFLEDAEVFTTPVPMRLADKKGRAHNGPLRRPMSKTVGLGVIELVRDEAWSLPWRVNGTVTRRVEREEMEGPADRTRPEGMDRWPWEIEQYGRTYQQDWEGQVTRRGPMPLQTLYSRR
jgi:hypothetical protein